MDATGLIVSTAHQLYSRADSPPAKDDQRPPVYKAVGLTLAVTSGVFIGSSFVLKKHGLLKANVKYNEEAGEGYGYLKNAFWWTGMTLMIVGEICNLVAYMFVDAILVTPLGALSVVICAVLSAIFLKERLSFVGKVGCLMCVIGSVVIGLNAPHQSAVSSIQGMQKFVIAPGFLSYAGVIIIGCIFVALWAGPRYGKKSMLVYLSICSLIGGLSVVATQGLGAAILAQIRGGEGSQFTQWFLYVLLVFVVVTLVTEIIYLNKALNIFNAALVTPTYYVFFTSSTIVTSAVLFRGFAGSVKEIITVVLGFLQICAGVVLLQLSKSSKDVPDAAVFSGDLDQVRTVAEQEEPESEPKADAIRGAAAIIRRMSMSRQKMEAEEARRIHEDRLRDQMEPIGENEQIEWDGLRRRKTVLDGPVQPLQRRKTLHPPLGMAYFPDDNEPQPPRPDHNDDEEQQRFDGGFMNSLRRRAQKSLLPGRKRSQGSRSPDARSPTHPVPLAEITVPPSKGIRHWTSPPQADGSSEQSHVYGLPPGLQSPQDTSYDAVRPLAPPSHNQSLGNFGPTPALHSAKRQFSFQNVFHRRRSDVRPESSESIQPVPRSGTGSRPGTRGLTTKAATEEERLGLVTGDSTHSPPPEYDDGDWPSDTQRKSALLAGEASAISPPPINEEEENESYEKPAPERRKLMRINREGDEDDEEVGGQPPTKGWSRHGGGGGPAFI
ncbi:MAG: hypothetical protein LQ344_003793 [Seirophora lacunosa]|nr:MAG: hypothetical protein LQ344_003793 [Seirophora lacunosa]